MVYVIIAVAMLFILGPVLLLRPSPRERRQARIRQRAMADKVRISPISLTRNKKFNALRERNPHIEDFQWSRYQLVAEEGHTGPSVRGEWLQRKTREGQLVWEPADVRQQTPQAVADLLAEWSAKQAKDFLVLELGPRSVSIVWNERGDVAEMDMLCNWMKRLMAV
jgi:hypothetical protein